MVNKNMMIAYISYNEILISEDYGKDWKQNITKMFTSIYTKDDLILCGTKAGLNISQDRGKTWRRASKWNGLANDKIQSIDYNGESIIIGTIFENRSAGVFRSDDMGETWSNHYIEQTEISRVKCYENKVYVSSRQGKNYFHIIDLKTNQVENFGPREEMTNFSIHKNKIYLCIMRGRYPLYVSEDKGRTWKGFLKEIADTHDFSCIAFLDDIMVIGIRGKGIILVDSNYKIIKEVKNLPHNWITCLLTQNDTIFAGTLQGLAVSNDSGDTWKTVEKLDKEIVDMHIDSNKLYVATTFECHVLDIVQN